MRSFLFINIYFLKILGTKNNTIGFQIFVCMFFIFLILCIHYFAQEFFWHYILFLFAHVFVCRTLCYPSYVTNSKIYPISTYPFMIGPNILSFFFFSPLFISHKTYRNWTNLYIAYSLNSDFFSFSLLFLYIWTFLIWYR